MSPGQLSLAILRGNLPYCFPPPPVCHSINKNGTFTYRRDLAGILLTAVGTAITVLVGSEDKSYAETRNSSHLKKNLQIAKDGYKHQSAS